MTKMFGNLTSTENMEASEDRVGGNFDPIPTNVYNGTITLAYAGQSSAGAHSITVHVDIDGKELRHTEYVTNRKGENFYVDKNDATKRHPLPGFTTIDDICLLASGIPLTEQETEEKIVELYDFQERKNMKKPTMCLTGLHGKPIKLAVVREIVDKEKKDQAGNYQPTGETRTQNNIDKALHPETGRTVNEYRNEVETPEYMTAWLQKNENKDRPKAKGVAGDSAAGASGSGNPLGSPTPKKSLFGK